MELSKKALKVAGIVALSIVALFVLVKIYQFTTPEFSLTYSKMQLKIVVIVAIFYGTLSYFITNSAVKSEVSFKKRWQWAFYVFGWLSGVANILFWLIMLALHTVHNYGEPFFNKQFHRRVYVWGIVAAIILALALTLVFVSGGFDEYRIWAKSLYRI